MKRQEGGSALEMVFWYRRISHITIVLISVRALPTTCGTLSGSKGQLCLCDGACRRDGRFDLETCLFEQVRDRAIDLSEACFPDGKSSDYQHIPAPADRGQTEANGLPHQPLDPVPDNGIADPTTCRKGKTAFWTIVTVLDQDQPAIAPRPTLLSHFLDSCTAP